MGMATATVDDLELYRQVRQRECATGFSLSVLAARQLLNERGRVSFAEIKEALGCSPSNLTHITDALERAGVARRVRNPENRREMFLEAI